MSEMRVFMMRDVIFGNPIFQQLSPRVILLLISTCTDHVFAPGDYIVRKGEIGDCMYVILRGAVAVVVGSDTPSKVVKTVCERESFGEACFLTGKVARMAWIRSERYTWVSRLDKD